jgi:hypothetical protein
MAVDLAPGDVPLTSEDQRLCSGHKDLCEAPGHGLRSGRVRAK